MDLNDIPVNQVQWKQYSILVVDDEPGMLSFLQRALVSRCGVVDTAGSVEQAAPHRAVAHPDETDRAGVVRCRGGERLADSGRHHLGVDGVGGEAAHRSPEQLRLPSAEF